MVRPSLENASDRRQTSKHRLLTDSLRGLNLENTRLGDFGTIQLCKYLVDHPRLSEINLAKNRITDVSASAIAEFVFNTYYLANLILHWNALT